MFITGKYDKNIFHWDIKFADSGGSCASDGAATSKFIALTNMIGNTVATIVVAKWEKEIDLPKAKKLIGLKR